MTAFLISIMAVFVVLIAFSDCDVRPKAKASRREQSFGLIPVLSVGVLVWASSACIASQQSDTPDPPDKPKVKISTSATGSSSANAVTDDTVTDDDETAKNGTSAKGTKNGPSIEVIINSGNDPKDAATDEIDTSDIFFVITKDGLNKLIAASGGDIEAFDVETLKQASAFLPLSLSQSRALSPVLRTATSPMILKRIFNPTNMNLVQELLKNSSAKTDGKTLAAPVDYRARSLFLMENSWIENPGIGQVVTETKWVEAGRPEEIAREVEASIREAVAARVQKLAKEKYGASRLDTSKMDLSFFDPSQAIAQMAQWHEQVDDSDDPDSVMVQTHVLVDLPQKEIDLLMAGVKTELQKERLAAVAIVVGLFWLGIALSSIAFRTYHSNSRLWKLVAIPVLTLAVIPCLVGAGLMIGEMYTGNLF